MDAAIKAKWLEALRSGDYRQGTGHLRSVSNDTYCCLGVLCDIADPEGWESTIPESGTTGNLHHGYGGTPSPDTLDRVGLPERFYNRPGISFKTEDNHEFNNPVAALTHQNDRMGKSFDEIADWIEVNL